MNIGNLNRRVAILKYCVQRDLFGGEEMSWEVKNHAWASIEPVSGTEFFTAQQVSAELVVKITLRYDPSITVLNRIAYLDKEYEIIGVSDADAAHKMTVLNCKERVSDELQRKAKKSKSSG